jgi:2'-5' RNA ligase
MLLRQLAIILVFDSGCKGDRVVIHDRIAIDIALLLPKAVNERVKSANAALLAERPEGFRFDESHLPHITLVQQFIRRANISALIERIDPILRGMQPLALRVTGVGSSATAAHFAIEKTSEMDELHRTLLDAVQPFEVASGAAAAFYSRDERALEPVHEPARDKDVAWVSQFRSYASYDRFTPHITLGIGPPPGFREPFEFTADRVALCHLGRFCTCRVVLREWTLETS